MKPCAAISMIRALLPKLMSEEMRGKEFGL